MKKEPTNSDLKLILLQMENRLDKNHAEQMECMRKENKELYAIKLIEKIVFGMISFILIAVLGALIAGVIR